MFSGFSQALLSLPTDQGGRGGSCSCAPAPRYPSTLAPWHRSTPVPVHPGTATPAPLQPRPQHLCTPVRLHPGTPTPRSAAHLSPVTPGVCPAAGRRSVLLEPAATEPCRSGAAGTCKADLEGLFGHQLVRHPHQARHASSPLDSTSLQAGGAGRGHQGRVPRGPGRRRGLQAGGAGPRARSPAPPQPKWPCAPGKRTWLARPAGLREGRAPLPGPGGPAPSARPGRRRRRRRQLSSAAAAASAQRRLRRPALGPAPLRSPRPLPSLRAALAALEDLAAPEAAACAICQRTFRDPVRADCGHQFCRACVVQFWAEEDGPFPCPECADDCWQRAVEPGRPPLSRRLLALEVAAAGSARDAPASEAALQLLCRADGGPLCRACRMAAAPEPPEWEPRWRKALRGKENKGSVEIMRKDLNDARDLHGQAESAAAVWKGHVMDRRKKALTDYKKLRAFFVEEEEHFLQEAEKAEEPPEDEGADPAERFRTLLQAVSELEKKHRDLGLSMLLQ
ncbi:E3 ubiquitin-protein ligase RNF187 [Trichechus inunguis]